LKVEIKRYGGEGDEGPELSCPRRFGLVQLLNRTSLNPLSITNAHYVSSNTNIIDIAVQLIHVPHLVAFAIFTKSDYVVRLTCAVWGAPIRKIFVSVNSLETTGTMACLNDKSGRRLWSKLYAGIQYILLSKFSIKEERPDI